MFSPEYKNLTPADIDLVDQIVEGAYESLKGREIAGLTVCSTNTAEHVWSSGVCVEASDVATRQAHSLGVFATREYHEDGYHFLTSFGPANQLPSEKDLILCLTWGQFGNSATQNTPVAYFGERQGMSDLLLPADYEEAFSSSSVSLRQVTCTPSREHDDEYVWLQTTPEEIAEAPQQPGIVTPCRFPMEKWEYPARIAA